MDREITDIDEANFYYYTLSVEVYNGSGKPRILREISIDYAINEWSYNNIKGE